MNARRTCLLMTLLLVLAAAPAWAQSAKTFAVLPFKIHGTDKYAHLAQGIPAMLGSRLTLADRFLPVDRDKVVKAVKDNPTSKEAAAKVISSLGCDYLIWGSATIMGEEASLDVQVQGRDGLTWSYPSQVKVDALIPSLEKVSKDINANVFKRPEVRAMEQQKQAVARMNPEILHNDARADQNYTLNPDLQWEGAQSGRWTSQSLYFPSAGCVVGDADKDGQSEIFILTSNSEVKAFRWQSNGLMPAGEWTHPAAARFQPLKINLFDVNRDGLKELLVTGYMDGDPLSVLLVYKDGGFSVLYERVPYYLNIVRTPPEYIETLVGQAKGRGTKPFDSNNVHEVDIIKGEFRLGRRLKLPDHTFIYNFTFLPEGDDYKVILVDLYDSLRVFNSQGTFLTSTDEKYAGSPIKIDFVETTPGLGTPRIGNRIEDQYYIPLRLLAQDLDGDGKHDLVVNRNISVASQFFARYRNFPQGEIHSLTWDGVGLPLVWKTRSIKGSVTDYGITDVNNDGKIDLWVTVNSHPGMVGLKDIKTSFIMYTLDLDSIPAGGVAKKQQ